MSETGLNFLELFLGLGLFIFLSAAGIGLMVWLVCKGRKEIE